MSGERRAAAGLRRFHFWKWHIRQMDGSPSGHDSVRCHPGEASTFPGHAPARPNTGPLAIPPSRERASARRRRRKSRWRSSVRISFFLSPSPSVLFLETDIHHLESVRYRPHRPCGVFTKKKKPSPGVGAVMFSFSERKRSPRAGG